MHRRWGAFAISGSVCVAGLAAAVGVAPGVDREEASGTRPQPARELSPEASDALENVIDVGDGIWSGGVPSDASSFEALTALGVRTVISVDAARPDIESLRDLGMRSVHVPIEYAGISTEQRLSLTRAIRELPRPIYVHCHHGKHRGPAAIALALISAGEMNSEEGRSLLERAGTSTAYPGLWACIENARPLADETIGLNEAPLPEIAEVGDLAAAMARMDRAWARLVRIRENDWITPDSHPDLVASNEAGVIADLLRASQHGLPDSEYGPGFIQALADAWREAGDLESAIITKDSPRADRHFSALASSCTDCHATTRDRISGETGTRSE